MADEKKNEQQHHEQPQHATVTKETTTVSVPRPERKSMRPVKQDGPDAETAKVKEGADPKDIVQTSLGPLDRETVVHNRVGGVGVVHMHNDPVDTVGSAPVAGTPPQTVKDTSTPAHQAHPEKK